jgi:hypothetical protein
MIGFHYMTDWATTYEGWWIQSPVHVGGAEMTLTPWVATPLASFQVTSVSAFYVDGKIQFLPHDMPIATPENTGTVLESNGKSPNYVILLVTPTMQKGMADYQFQATPLPMRRGGGMILPQLMDGRTSG